MAATSTPKGGPDTDTPGGGSALAAVNSREANRARDLVAQGQKRMSSWFGGAGKYEEASDLFQKAGNMFKVAKCWDEGGKAYEQAADCHLRIKGNYDAATQFINAANCYRKSNSVDSEKALTRAIDLLVDEGKFSIAARHQQELAELYEQEGDVENAMTAYEKAADFFEGDNSNSRASTCLAKVATFAAQLENYDKAIGIYEKVGTNCLESNLLKWSAKDHFMKAGMLHLAKGDSVGARRAMEHYQEMDVSFSQQRECKFVLQLLDAFEAYDSDAFTTAIVEYDTITKLTPWQTTILLRVKNHIKAQEGDSIT